MAMPIVNYRKVNPDYPHFAKYESILNEVTGEIKPYVNYRCVICGSMVETDKCIRTFMKRGEI